MTALSADAEVRTIATPQVHRNRLRWLWKQSAFAKYEDLSRVVSIKIKGKEALGYVSWYLKNAKTVDAGRAEVFAQALAGSGALVDDYLVLLRFLLGFESDPKTCLRDDLSDEISASNRCCTQTPSDLGRYRARRDLHVNTSRVRRAS